MSDYSTTTAALIEQAKGIEKTLPIKNDACRSKLFLHPYPTAKVFLFFHGFTAGPYQFEPIGKKLFDAGYNVLVPLQPGHGVAGNWNRDNPPPLPTEREIYQDFALSWLEVAQNLGQQVIVGGLSTGGNLAVSLALEHPQKIEKALLFAPYISGNNAIVNFGVEILPIYYEWLNKDNPGNFGYDGFRIPALRLFLDMGQEITERVKKDLAVPVFIICSESDQTINHSELQYFSRATIKQQSKSWYHSFDKFFEIPHTMMTKAEGNKYQDLLITVAKAYIESDITWTEVMEIGYQILQGKSFDTAVKKLNLSERVSQDLSVMLAVMNKKMIIDYYQL
ncbi:phospholipase/carboxylesterase [Scytonema sp. HK-05]|uniref:alpha/beta hydrolase n=1 Tax=Scytonema sp. HK-05 TaxID=1137095 RepID=UPI000937FEC7|nr:alpha/beta fold hydrolase [Scytonema sp. HK-05]OKH58936.1 alpha/beta hydrolase [Scytonema sp. HK-05]BAY47101.1 phospholipase/carboxylesterase [Scytonema sp. HK-05]